jgi:excisionase family DNA binding protein
VETRPPADDDDPCLDLAQALDVVIQRAIKEGVAAAIAEIVPQVLAQAKAKDDRVLVMDVKEAATRLGLSKSKVHRLIGAGEIASVSMGRRRKIPVQAIDAYLRRLGVETPNA